MCTIFLFDCCRNWASRLWHAQKNTEYRIQIGPARKEADRIVRWLQRCRLSGGSVSASAVKRRAFRDTSVLLRAVIIYHIALCPKSYDFEKQNFENSKFWPPKFLQKIWPQISFFLHNSSTNAKNCIFEKSKFWTPLIFDPPKLYIFESPGCTAPLYQIWWNFAKGYRN